MIGLQIESMLGSCYQNGILKQGKDKL